MTVSYSLSDLTSFVTEGVRYKRGYLIAIRSWSTWPCLDPQWSDDSLGVLSILFILPLFDRRLLMIRDSHFFCTEGAEGKGVGGYSSETVSTDSFRTDSPLTVSGDYFSGDSSRRTRPLRLIHIFEPVIPPTSLDSGLHIITDT